MEPELHVFTDPMVKLDRDVPRVLEDPVLHVSIRDWLARVVLAANAEENVRLREHL